MNPVALLFPGQGSQYTGMGKQWTEQFPYLNEVYEEASDILGIDMKKRCEKGTNEELAITENTQPSILTISYAAYVMYVREVGMKPAIAAGHSLGEITALTCAESMTFADALKMVQMRGKFMQQVGNKMEGKMAAVIGLSVEMVEKVCQKWSIESKGAGMVVVSNTNSERQAVISGYRLGVEAVSETLSDLGAKMVPLRVSAPFHSPYMQDAAEKFREFLTCFTFRNPKFLVLSNLDGEPHRQADEIAEKLVKQMSSPVQWAACLNTIVQLPVSTTVELGPSSVLTSLFRQEHPSVLAYSADQEVDLQMLIRKSRLSYFEKCLAHAVSTKNRNSRINNEGYRQNVVAPYREIEKILARLEQNGEKPSEDEYETALSCLLNIFDAKEVETEEIKDRLADLKRVGGRS
ncbi:ACP S-malonyltransferase [Paenibacillus sp. 2TAB23]|uniref:ACP S-malonyltransferase n=1 Tax=Paenibacillus sp. 2TAB23 TaxID=3233004 RepID=UPI003F9611BE